MERLTKVRRAFTLIEMVAVLAIIAIVSHLAVRSLSRLDSTRRIAAANKMLEDLRLAVYEQSAEDGLPGGFLADMGRLPRPAPLHSGVSDPTNTTFSELWRMPAGAREYALRQAVVENLSSGDPSLVASNVYVGTGWRGPYLHLPPGRDNLYDAWGNAMEAEDAAGLERLVATNGYAVAAAHYGPVAQRGSEGSASVSLLPPGMTASGGARLVVHIAAQDADGNPCNPPLCDYRLYSPSGDGRISVAAVTNATSPVVFERVLPGVHVLWESRTTSAHCIVVRPGGSPLNLKLLVPKGQ
ncbi:MAG: prepilin-type N-terminal cleavage/methylation domain-containing protein [Kiritimatiellae bacterium]|nr:prepilin-type N-terminal cleavage/methylation domain-containing protein [Kiritimatiellia bacterium]